MKKVIRISLVIIIAGMLFASTGCFGSVVREIRASRSSHHVRDRGELVKVDESYSGFQDIKVDAAFLDRVVLKEGDGYTVRGANYEGWGGLDVELIGDTLTVVARDKNWEIHLGIDEFFWDHREDAWVEITYPADGSLNDVDVKLDAGDIRVNNLDCISFHVNNSFGDIDASAVKCESLRITADAGRIDLSNIDVTGSAVLNNKFGDVELTGIMAKVMTVTLDAGDVKADRINTGDMKVKSSFGNVSIDRIEYTGLCDIESKAGDVSLSILKDENDISYSLKVDAGSIWVEGMKTSGSVTTRNTDAKADLTVDSNFGDIRVKFISE
jgi:hypothetical protein